MSTNTTTERAVRAEPATSDRPRGMSRSVGLLGFWSAILSAISSIGWPITMGIQNAISPIPVGISAEAFRPIHMLKLYPSLLLALAFIVLMVCIHLYAPEEKKVWSLIALAIGVVYATMATINYQIQLVSVQHNLLSGESAGMEMFVQSNFRSVFTALATSYVYMCVAMVFAAPVFGGGRIERWIRWIFLAMAPVALAQLAWSVFDLSPWVISVGAIWVVGAPIAFTLLAVLFKRSGRES